MRPAALVKVSLKRIEIKDDALASRIAEASNPYVLATIGERRIGRSRPIPAGETTFDLEVDPAGFTHELRVDHGDSVGIRVEVWQDTDSKKPLASTSAIISEEWTSGERTIEGAFELTLDVVTRIVPDPLVAVAPRSAEGTDTLATLRIVDTVVVSIQNVGGLYKPTDTFAFGARGALPVDGYKSDDNRGRIYLNRNLHGTFIPNLQQIELVARVSVVRGNLPAHPKIRWTIIDVDDPWNDNPEVHPEGGFYADRSDYDRMTGAPLGASGWDNEGHPDHKPRWSAVPPYSLAIESEAGARTNVVHLESRVVLHCPNVAGDNLVVRADLLADSHFESFADQTGIMTMWNRVDVEYLRMESARPLLFERAVRGFEPGCLQLDVAPERVVPDVPYVAKTEALFDLIVPSFAASEFRHRGVPGWFLAMAALRAFETPPRGPNLFEGFAEVMTVGDLEYVDLRGDFSEAFLFTCTWGDESSPHTAEFFLRERWTFADDGSQLTKDPWSNTWRTVHPPHRAHAKPDWTRCRILPHEYWPQFTAHDWGTTVHFGLRWQTAPFYSEPNGYRVPKGPVWVTIGPEGNRPLLGESVGRGAHCFGMALIFTTAIEDVRTGSDVDEEIALTLFHELTHGFDFPHMCGSYSYETERNHACSMNYYHQWLLEPELPFPRRLIADTGLVLERELCARHIKGLRRTHFEDNPLLASGKK